MFSDEILEAIFSSKEVQLVPIGYQATMVHEIDRILQEKMEERYATLCEPELF